MYRVLIVDDDRSVLYLLKRFKEWNVYNFVIAGEAGDGKEALKKLTAEPFDLVITDIKMPGMDGIEFLTELKIRKLDVCLIFLSTHSDFEYAKQGIRLGVFDYMTKPVENAALRETLARVERHLAESNLQKMKVAEEKKIIQESINLYYPRIQEKKLTDLLLLGSTEAFDAATVLLAELSRALPDDLFKTARLAETTLTNVCLAVYHSFPWLEKLEGLAFDNVMAGAESGEAIKSRFIGGIAALLEIIRKYELHHSDSVVRKTCQYVIGHIEEEINLERIAQEIHVSRDYIGKLFKQRTGRNFSDYVTKVKMEHAKYLLHTGDYKNYEISEMLGYSSPDYFCRLFKTHTGHTPLEFRKMRI